jgi:hypothetical protein
MIVMGIATGLSALKAAADLTRSIRDAAKAGTLKPDEFAGRVAEVYDYIGDSKEALLTAQEEMTQLRVENEKLKTKVFHHSANWRKLPDGTEDGPFCPVCSGEGCEMRLTVRGMVDQTGPFLYLECPKSHLAGIGIEGYRGRGRELSYAIPKELLPDNRYFLKP